MLAQGQSSSAKRGGLAADVSSGLIFLKEKKKEKLGKPRAGGVGRAHFKSSKEFTASEGQETGSVVISGEEHIGV